MKFALALLAAGLASAQPVHYDVQLRPDFVRRTLHGVTEVRSRDPKSVTLVRQKGVTITHMPPGAVEANGAISITSAKARFVYEAKPGAGFRWLDDGSIVTMFHCGAWMICDAGPAYRATLRLEIVLPESAAMHVAGPGQLTRRYRDGEGEHYVYEVRHAVQSFLFSFAVAKLDTLAAGRFELLAARRPQPGVLAVTAKAHRFFRDKAGVDWPEPQYRQAFLPLPGAGQEAAGLALMSHAYLEELESRDAVELLAHEMAHQWWAVLVGIRSWSDFWLNEGIAEFMTAAFVEHHQGRAAYEKKLADMEQDLAKIRAEGKDRPLHWEKWKSATEALGRVPYLKGGLFLARLRKELGDAPFWRGLALYTTRHSGALVDSRDFQRAMEEAAGRPLAAAFDEGVYR